MYVCSVYAGKTSTPRSATRIQGRRNASATQIAPSPRQRNLPTPDKSPLSPVNVQPGPLSSDPLQRTNSWQSTASSVSGGGASSSRTPPVPKPRTSASSVPSAVDQVDLEPAKRTGREPRRRTPPSEQAKKPGVRSQSSPADRAKPHPQVPAPPSVKGTTPSRNGVVTGHSGIPRTQHHVDRSLGNMDSPLSAFVDRSGLVFDVRSKVAYRRGRLLGKVRLLFLRALLGSMLCIICVCVCVQQLKNLLIRNCCNLPSVVRRNC